MPNILQMSSSQYRLELHSSSIPFTIAAHCQALLEEKALLPTYATGYTGKHTSDKKITYRQNTSSLLARFLILQNYGILRCHGE
jgi:hypothetical protein